MKNQRFLKHNGLSVLFIVGAAFFIVMFSGPVWAQDRRPMTVDDLLAIGRISQPALSPNGRNVLFTVEVQSPDENTRIRQIHLLDLSTGTERQLTSAGSYNAQPVWLNDETMAFVSNRKNGAQIWSMSILGGEPIVLTDLSTGVGGLRGSPNGRLLLFASEVDPDCPDDDCNEQKAKEESTRKTSGRIFTSLPYRVWNYWKNDKRSHLFVQRVHDGKAIDLTPGDHDVPPIDLGGSWDYDASPDGSEIAFAMNTESSIATSTNNDIFIVPSAGGTPLKISVSKGVDAQPTYSPDGRYIAYVSMLRARFEADKRVLVVYDREKRSISRVTDDLDLSIGETVWAPDGKSIFVTAAYRGAVAIFRIDITTGAATPIVSDGYNRSINVLPDGSALIFSRQRMHMPAELFSINADGAEMTKLTGLNDDLIGSLDLRPAEKFWFEGADQDSVQGYIVRPPGFDAGKTYPMTFLIHGGPQGQWADQFHFRWNAEMFAARGHVVVLINPRGSTGFGQAFTDAITRDWGGAVYEDLMKGLEYVLQRYSFIDRERLAAAGASYGGYMINWIAVNENPFRCLVNHDGVFNPWSMYGSTEELWFPEWEFGGTPYENPELYDRWSPLRRAKNMETPMLVIHSQRDYRLDVSEGFQVFTALQRQGIPSKMLYFPDEGHFVQKPANARLWWTTVLDWIDQYTGQE